MTTMMNELEFRRRVQLNPHDLDPECQAFLDAAEPQRQSELQRFMQRCVVEQDTDLRDIRAAMQIAVPEGLAERALLRTAHNKKGARSNQDSNEKRRGQQGWFDWLSGWLSGRQLPAAFATVAIAVAGTVMLLNSAPSSAAQIAVDHIASEPAHGHLAGHGFQSDERVQHVFNRIGLKMNDSVARIEFAANCDVEGKLGAHLLLERDGKPVTVLVYPQKDKSEANLENGGEMVAMPYGSLAVFAEDDATRRDVLNAFKQSLAPSQFAMLNPY